MDLVKMENKQFINKNNELLMELIYSMTDIIDSDKTSSAGICYLI